MGRGNKASRGQKERNVHEIENQAEGEIIADSLIVMGETASL